MQPTNWKRGRPSADAIRLPMPHGNTRLPTDGGSWPSGPTDLGRLREDQSYAGESSNARFDRSLRSRDRRTSITSEDETGRFTLTSVGCSRLMYLIAAREEGRFRHSNAQPTGRCCPLHESLTYRETGQLAPHQWPRRESFFAGSAPTTIIWRADHVWTRRFC